MLTRHPFLVTVAYRTLDENTTCMLNFLNVKKYVKTMVKLYNTMGGMHAKNFALVEELFYKLVMG